MPNGSNIYITIYRYIQTAKLSEGILSHCYQNNISALIQCSFIVNNAEIISSILHLLIIFFRIRREMDVFHLPPK